MLTICFLYFTRAELLSSSHFCIKKELQTGFEPVTSSLPRMRSTSWATAAFYHRSAGISFCPSLRFGLSGRRGSNPPPIAWKAIALPNELLPLLCRVWGRVDSNHWTPKRTDLQSVAIATMRLPHFRLPNWRELEPMKGLEPPTGWLQISYSTNWVTSAFSACQTTLFLLIWGCKNTTFFQTHQNFFSLFTHFYLNKLVYNTILYQKKLTTTSQPHRKTHIFIPLTAIFHLLKA